MSSFVTPGSAFRRRQGGGRRRLLMPILFVLLVLPVLLFSAVIVPPGEVPDEVAHILRANSLLHGSIIGSRRPIQDRAGKPTWDSGVVANAGLLSAGFTFLPGMPKILTLERLQQLRATPWAPAAAWVSVPNTAVYMPLLYMPAAFGLGMAHLAGYGPYDAILAARLCNALAFAATGLLALLLARRAQGALFVALALPMTASLAASCNQDGMVIAMACLAAALLTRGSVGSWWGGILALAVVMAAKPLYLPLAALVAIAAPPRSGLPLRLAGAALAALPAMLWYAVAQRYAVVPFIRGEPYPAGPLWPGTPGQVFGTTDPQQQLQVFLHDPSLLLRLPVEALRATLETLRLEFVGVLGTLDLPLPPWLYTAWTLALLPLLFAELLADPRETESVRPWAAVLGLACIAAALFALFDGQYLSWTLVGAAAVDGVQGRYFIPLLPFVALVLPRVRLPGGAGLRALLRAPAVLAAASGSLVIPALLVTTYYLR